MRRILVLAPPEGHCEWAVSLAGELAAREGLEVLLVRVLEEGVLSQPRGDSGPDAERLRSLLVDAEVRVLEGIAAPLRAASHEVETIVRWGVPWEVVLDLVERHRIDLVVKPARGLSHEGRVFFGATALHLFRKCPCPVWVVGDDGRLPSRILAAIDPGDDPTRRSVARRILEWSQWSAGLAGAELHLASCWHAPAADMLKEELSPEELEAYVDDARSRALEGLERVVDCAAPALPADRVHLLEGDAREVLPRFADERDFDLIVMGTLGREGLAGEVLGETAELVVRAVHSSVLTVSPRSRSVR